MTDVNFTCPNCESPVQAATSKSGKLSTCPSCSCPITIPFPPIEPGMEIGGFRVKKLLGIGGMGEVWMAEQLSMNRNVALKILSPTLIDDPEFVESFMHEVRLVAKLSHPNIVTAYDAGEQNGVYYMATSLISGKELQNILDERQRLSELQALKIVMSIAKALKYAWDKFRIIHRDIKPGNIMIDRDDNVKLMDMGISKSIFEHEGHGNGMTCGTPNYMSPEQAKDINGIDFRTDIYSLGITLFRMLAGRMPFSGQTTEEIIRKHITEPPPSILLFAPKTSSGTVELLNKMIQKDRFSRHNSWQEVINETDKAITLLKNDNSKNKFKIKDKTLYISVVAVLCFIIATLAIVLNNKIIINQNVQTTFEKTLPPSDLEDIPIAPAPSVDSDHNQENTIEPIIETITAVEPSVDIKQVENVITDGSITHLPLAERMLNELDYKIVALKDEQDYRLIIEELAKIKMIAIIPMTIDKINMLSAHLDKWKNNHVDVAKSAILENVAKMQQEKKYDEIIDYLSNYQEPWVDETADLRASESQKFYRFQRWEESKVQRDEENRLLLNEMNFYESIVSGDYTSAIKFSKDLNTPFLIAAGESGFLAIKDALEIAAEFDKGTASALQNRLNKNITLEMIDGKKIRYQIDEVGENYFLGTTKSDDSTFTSRILFSRLSMNQRFRLDNRISDDLQILLNLMHDYSPKNHTKYLRLFDERSDNPLFSNLKNYLEARAFLFKSLNNLVIRPQESMSRFAARISKASVNPDQALAIYEDSLKFRQHFSKQLSMPLFSAVMELVVNSLPLDQIFAGKISRLDLIHHVLEIEYDFSDQNQVNDFSVYQPITLGQRSEIKNSQLSITSSRHGAVQINPTFKKFMVNFTGKSLLRDFNHLLIASDANLAFIANGFGKIKEGYNGVIRNWKIAGTVQMRYDQQPLKLLENVSGRLTWDGEVVRFSLAGKEWPKEIFVAPAAKFGIATFASTNSYNNIKIIGILDEKWLLEHFKKVLSL
ncbi:MAG: serine/threonine-protein kinase [Lentisphaeria bacterium]